MNKDKIKEIAYSIAGGFFNPSEILFLALKDLVENELIKATESHQWIGVHKRLPHELDRVLVYIEGDIRNGGMVTVGMIANEIWIDDYNYPLDNDTGCVYAWQPLPEFPDDDVFSWAGDQS